MNCKLKLNTQSVGTYFNAPMAPFQPGGAFEVKIPQSTVNIAKPLSYDFRVAEFIDAKGAVAKVGLQYQIWEHDNYGEGRLVQEWTDVERVKIQL